MAYTLGGSIFIRNAVLFDYSFKESLLSLCEFCDQVSVVMVEGEDRTYDLLQEVMKEYSSKMIVTILPSNEWDMQWGKGQSKLCHFSDIAISKLETDYNFYQQADEILAERCYSAVRKAIATGDEAFLISRINLWKDPYHRLDVPQERKPCSTEIIRLAKTQYRSYGDAESLAVPYVNDKFLKEIVMYHNGFVRKREVMKAKVENMQKNVFEMENADAKLYLSETFNPYLWFSDDDLKLIDEPLPKLMQSWAAERVYED